MLRFFSLIKQNNTTKVHDHEFVPEVRKDWNDQLKHEIQQQAIRKQKRAMLFQQTRQQERE